MGSHLKNPIEESRTDGTANKKLVLEVTGKAVDGAVPPAVKGGNDDFPKGGSGKRGSFKC